MRTIGAELTRVTPGIFEIEPRGERATFGWTELFYLPWGWFGVVLTPAWFVARPWCRNTSYTNGPAPDRQLRRETS